MKILPSMNVPVVRTTVLDVIVHPRSVFTPDACPFSERISITVSMKIWRWGVPSSVSLASLEYVNLSACARGAWTAGPLLLFSILIWIIEASISCPISPPSASISLTRFPFARPPIEGLQLILPIVSGDCVTRSVSKPAWASDRDASIPACPPPITIAS